MVRARAGARARARARVRARARARASSREGPRQKTDRPSRQRTQALRLEETLRERIAALPPADFEDILHSVFKEDEWKLFALGGAMGLAIGLAQAYALTR